MAGFAMCGKMTTQPENREELVKILASAAALMREAAGCQMYIVYKDAEDAAAVWVTELWDGKESHDASLTLQSVRDLIGQAAPLLTGTPEGHTLIPITGKGLD